MRYLGQRKIETFVHGHQNCGICHPQIKSGRASSKQELNKLLLEHEEEEFQRHQDELLEDVELVLFDHSEEWKNWEEYNEPPDPDVYNWDYDDLFDWPDHDFYDGHDDAGGGC